MEGLRSDRWRAISAIFAEYMSDPEWQTDRNPAGEPWGDGDEIARQAIMRAYDAGFAAGRRVAPPPARGAGQCPDCGAPANLYSQRSGYQCERGHWWKPGACGACHNGRVHRVAFGWIDCSVCGGTGNRSPRKRP